VKRGLTGGLLLVFAACGGGGGGGGDDAIDIADAAYTGVRTTAYIDANNAEALVLGAYGGVNYESIIPLSTTKPDATDVATAVISDPFKLASVFKQTTDLVKKDVQVKTQSLLDPTVECLNYPLGTLSDNLVETVSASTDTVKGDIYYSNCDVGGVILDGKVSLSATWDLLTDAISLSMTMNPVSYNDGITKYSLIGILSGTVATNLSGFLVSHIALNVTLDDPSGKTYWLNDYAIDETEETNGLRSTVSGRYYENNYGFVDFFTDPLDTIFVPYNPSDPTYDGRIEYTGSSGSHANLWLGVNQSDYCINVFNASGVVNIGTCAP
jgi:hypothetical protein